MQIIRVWVDVLQRWLYYQLIHRGLNHDQEVLIAMMILLVFWFLFDICLKELFDFNNSRNQYVFHVLNQHIWVVIVVRNIHQNLVVVAHVVDQKLDHQQ